MSRDRNLLLIAATEVHALFIPEDEAPAVEALPVREMVRQAMTFMLGHWLVTDEDRRFQCAVVGVCTALLETGRELESNALVYELDLLNRMSTGAPISAADLERAASEAFVQLIPLWDEVKQEHSPTGANSDFPMHGYIYDSQGMHGAPVMIRSSNDLGLFMIRHVRAAMIEQREIRITTPDDEALFFHCENGNVIYSGTQRVIKDQEVTDLSPWLALDGILRDTIFVHCQIAPALVGHPHERCYFYDCKGRL